MASVMASTVGNVSVVGDRCHAVAEVEGHFDDAFQYVHLTGDVVRSTVSKCVGDGAGEYLVGHGCLPPGVSGVHVSPRPLRRIGEL